MKSASSLSAKPPHAKRNATSMKSKTDWTKLHDGEAGVANEEHPEINTVIKGIVRRGLAPAASKAMISLRVDEDVLSWFKAQGPGYQTRINTVLRAFRDASA